jgi:hypothetical protein
MVEPHGLTPVAPTARFVGPNPPKRIILRQGYGGYPPRIHSRVYPAFVAVGYYGGVGHPWLSAKEGKITTDKNLPTISAKV